MRRCRSRCRRSAREPPGCARSTPLRRASRSGRMTAANRTRCRDAPWPLSCSERRHVGVRRTDLASRSFLPACRDMARTQVSMTAATDAQARDAGGRCRVVIERLRPQIDAGRFPIKRTVGDKVAVTVDMFVDGHDLLAGVLKYRRVPAGRPAAEPALQARAPRRPGPASSEASADPAQPWTEIPLTLLDNDSWGASFRVTELGEYEYTVEGWVDRFGTWLKGLIAKADAGQDVSSE